MLRVILPFADYAVGDLIADDDEVHCALAHAAAYVVRVADAPSPDPVPGKTPAANPVAKA